MLHNISNLNFLCLFTLD